MNNQTVETPVCRDLVAQEMASLGIVDMSQATIREISRLARDLEQKSGAEFIHMEMGVPGLPPSEIGIEAEIAALRAGAAQAYPPVDGVPALKVEMAKFVRNFIGVEVSPEGCLPTVGSMQGGIAYFMLVNRLVKGRDRVLFIDPGFPVQKQQLRVLGYEFDTFDVYNYRGKKLREKLEEYLRKGRTSAILYSNPNNPSWICLTDEELQTIGELSDIYNVPVIEDLAYFGMDFREDLSVPGQPPYQSSVANYTNNWLMLISSSKAFSYSGQRIGCMVVSDHMFSQEFPDLEENFPSTMFGRALIYGVMYALSSGVAASPQYGFAALLGAANRGEYNFLADVREYGRRAEVMKSLFTKHGFAIVYDQDEGRPLADGFYFTVAYPGMGGGELLRELLYFGISAISLGSTGSSHTEGLRACVSHVNPSQFPVLEARLAGFQALHARGEEREA